MFASVVYYIYAFGPSSFERDIGPKGLFGTAVRSISAEGISAVVSEIPMHYRLLPERRHLMAHQEILRFLVENTDAVVPVKFGTLAEDSDSVRRIIFENQPLLRRLLDNFFGKLEMDVRARFSSEPIRAEELEAGQELEETASRRRQHFMTRIKTEWAGICTKLKTSSPRNERELARVSCLIERQHEAEFRSAVELITDELGDDVDIELDGPAPPFNFVEEHVRTKKNELGQKP